MFYTKSHKRVWPVAVFLKIWSMCQHQVLTECDLLFSSVWMNILKIVIGIQLF